MNPTFLSTKRHAGCLCYALHMKLHRSSISWLFSAQKGNRKRDQDTLVLYSSCVEVDEIKAQSLEQNMSRFVHHTGVLCGIVTSDVSAATAWIQGWYWMWLLLFYTSVYKTTIENKLCLAQICVPEHDGLRLWQGFFYGISW